VAEKRSTTAAEDDFREETGDKEDCGNDRTLALPTTTSKRLKKRKSVLPEQKDKRRKNQILKPTD